MTAAVAVAAPRQPGRPGGLAWITWRQHRLAIVATAGLLSALAVALVAYGLVMHHDFSALGLTSCGSLDGRACQAPLDIFEQRYETAAMYFPRILEFLPALLGVFVGAPLVARELESGTYRFAWTQGRNRTTWLTAQLALLGPYLVILTLAFAALFSWWFRPWEQVIGRLASGEAYEITGVIFAARTLFAFTLGVALGAVIRRTVPAMLATATTWLGVVWPSTIYLRPLIERPVSVPSSSNSIADNAWTISSWWQNRAGQHLSASALDQLLAQARQAGVQGSAAFQQFLTEHGWTQWSSYQPNSRFWPLQLIEASGYVAISAALAASAIWWIARKAT